MVTGIWLHHDYCSEEICQQTHEGRETEVCHKWGLKVVIARIQPIKSSGILTLQDDHLQVPG